MTAISIACLQDCLKRYRTRIPELARLGEPSETDSLDALIAFYARCYPLLEQALWSGAHDFRALLDCYQSLFREQDALIRRQAQETGRGDERYRFIISIPVADRPAHLRTCLESIYQLCRRFGYGGQDAGVYTHVRVVIAEDSREPDNIRQHIELAQAYRRKGLQVLHFAQDEQVALLQAIPDGIRSRLDHILTTQPAERFYLKGQAANRNLSILKCLQLTDDRDRTLYYFVDSDEAFCVNRMTDSGEQAVYALSYFHTIDRLFRSTDTLLLTGKMVGDPPVSPSVMAANFLDDVNAFLSGLAGLPADRDCRFHGSTEQPGAGPASGAAYHDMAGLFGFEKHDTTYPYRCPLSGRHDHAACLRTFARRLSAFFFGVHLTRKTLFDHGAGLAETTPARTVYPGNYIARYAGLRYAIPFAHLRLRMSGPTAGRLIAAEIGARFASVNLPHLHRRTNDAGLDEAFRPGVQRAADTTHERIDLSNEFERQFFGDLMLFTTQTLVTEADVGEPFEREVVERIMAHKEQELLALYRHKHQAIRDKARQLEERVFNAGHWWLDTPDLNDALAQIRVFIDNIHSNFGERSPAWRQIQSASHRDARKQQILQALTQYRNARDAWDTLFE